MEWMVNLWMVSAVCGAGILMVFVVSPLFRKTHTVFWRYCLWVALAVRLVLPFDISIPGMAVQIPLLASWEEGGKGREGNGGISREKEDDVNGKAISENLQKPNLQKAEHAGSPADTGDLPGPNPQDSADISGLPETGRMLGSNPRAANRGKGAVRQEEVFRQQLLFWEALIWAAGVAGVLAWQAASYAYFYRKTEKTKRFFTRIEHLPVYTSPAVRAPMLMGLKNPQIVIAEREYEKEQLDYILAHELAHYRRKDLFVKLLFAVAKTIHWYNPCVYLMERQAAKDMEQLCDSRVVRDFSREEKKQYGQTLLDCASFCKRRQSYFGVSDFSGEVKTLKERLANIFSAPTRKRGIFVAALGVIVSICGSLFVTFASSGENAGSIGGKAEKENIGTEISGALETETGMPFGLAELSVEAVANAVYGEVFPKLVYASEERVMMYGSWGLLAYDLKNGKIARLADLKTADLCRFQGDQATHIEVSKDGGTLLLYNGTAPTERFLYDVDSGRMEYTDQETLGEDRFDGLLERGERTFARTPSGKIIYLSADSLFTEDGELFHPDDMQGLCVIVSDGAWGGAQIYPLFSEYYEKVREHAVPWLKMEDRGRVLGKEFLHGDEAGWRYFLEEDLEKESALWECAEQMEPLLLTRYRDGERQVLDSLLFEDAWLECPVLFVDGRILYKAAVTPDIAGVKTATLISIAADGSDRKAADTVMYRVFDGICEDGGWIYYSGWTNDGTGPKPLCRISPDFSVGAQFVEDIPGLLCGVKDGFAYYLASREKEKSGIWKRNLSNGEETVYDKWGIFAEDMTLYSAREMTFVPGELRDFEAQGCGLLYQTDDQGVYLMERVVFE